MGRTDRRVVKGGKGVGRAFCPSILKRVKVRKYKKVVFRKKCEPEMTESYGNGFGCKTHM